MQYGVERILTKDKEFYDVYQKSESVCVTVRLYDAYGLFDASKNTTLF